MKKRIREKLRHTLYKYKKDVLYRSSISTRKYVEWVAWKLIGDRFNINVKDGHWQYMVLNVEGIPTCGYKFVSNHPEEPHLVYCKLIPIEMVESLHQDNTTTNNI